MVPSITASGRRSGCRPVAAILGAVLAVVGALSSGVEAATRDLPAAFPAPVARHKPSGPGVNPSEKPRAVPMSKPLMAHPSRAPLPPVAKSVPGVPAQKPSAGVAPKLRAKPATPAPVEAVEQQVAEALATVIRHSDIRPEPVKVDARRTEDGARVVFSWNQPVEVEHLLDERSLVLFFSLPFGDTDLSNLPEQVEGWIENVQYGYDSVLLTLAAGIVPSLTRAGSVVQLELLPANTEREASAATQAGQKLAGARLAYYRSLVLRDNGDLLAARGILDDLLVSQPANLQALVLAAQVDQQLGRWREALTRYDRALELSRNDPAIVAARAQMFKDHGGYVHTEHETRTITREWRQHRTGMVGRIPLPRDLAFGYGFDARQIHSDNATRVDGSTGPVRTDRQFAHMDVSYSWPEGMETTATAYLQEGMVGGGLGHKVTDSTGTTEMQVRYHEPDKDQLQSLLDRGRKDRLHVQREQRLAERWVMTAGIGVSQYGLSNQNTVATTAGGEGSLRYTVSRAFPSISLGYILDAEYLLGARRRGSSDDQLLAQCNAVDPTCSATLLGLAAAYPGIRSDPSSVAAQLSPGTQLDTVNLFRTILQSQGEEGQVLGINAREVHMADLLVQDELWDFFRYALNAGWAQNRKGTGGPYWQMQLIWEPLADLEVITHFGQAASLTLTHSDIETFGGSVRLRF